MDHTREYTVEHYAVRDGHTLDRRNETGPSTWPTLDLGHTAEARRPGIPAQRLRTDSGNPSDDH
ncbi:hypothetical protein ACL02S_12065 [Nocardia sp. 004]|uniref:hypothetical protein n=1 Tax=Nocardia sp. 004 TaxID=3385978 RepID=UPI0039A39CC1